MAHSVASIAKLALDNVSKHITDAVLSAVLTKIAQGVYDRATDSYPDVPTVYNGRCVEVTSKQIPVSDIFPQFVVGPADKLFMLEQFSVLPAENDTLTVKGRDYQVMAVGDTLLSGSLPYVAVR